MNGRQLFILALRVLGVWFLLDGVKYVSALAVYIYQARQAISPFQNGVWPEHLPYVIGYGVPAFVETVLALSFIVYAPLIASFFRFDESAPAGAETLSANEVYRVGSQLLGIYALLLAIRPASYGVTGNLYRDPDMPYFGWNVQFVVEAGLYGAVGLFLILGASRVAACLSRIRYDPDRDAYVPPPIEHSDEEPNRS